LTLTHEIKGDRMLSSARYQTDTHGTRMSMS
jgi:hypothetical protein